MNDIFHERHMNNIIAADREQNVHVRPTTSTRIGSSQRPKSQRPKSQWPNSDRSLAHQLGVRCVQADAFEVPGGLAANSWKNVNSKPRLERVRSKWNQPGQQLRGAPVHNARGARWLRGE
jgi:hypothetical protein